MSVSRTDFEGYVHRKERSVLLSAEGKGKEEIKKREHS